MFFCRRAATPPRYPDGLGPHTKKTAESICPTQNQNGTNPTNIIVPLLLKVETEWAQFDLSTVKLAEQKLKISGLI
jgi:hypothetical protein